jgi:hypothetical protein
MTMRPASTLIRPRAFGSPPGAVEVALAACTTGRRFHLSGRNDILDEASAMRRRPGLP